MNNLGTPQILVTQYTSSLVYDYGVCVMMVFDSTPGTPYYGGNFSGALYSPCAA